jgi:hypothetical protein
MNVSCNFILIFFENFEILWNFWFFFWNFWNFGKCWKFGPFFVYCMGVTKWEGDSKEIVTRWAMCRSRMLPSSYPIKLQLTFMKYNKCYYYIVINISLFNPCNMNDIRNAPVFFRVLIKTFETNSKIQDILIFALVQYEWHSGIKCFTCHNTHYYIVINISLFNPLKKIVQYILVFYCWSRLSL